MRERTLLIGAVVFSLIGLFALLMLASYAQPQQLKIAELEDKVGKIVSVAAEVKSTSYTADAVFLTIKDSTGEISAVFFGSPKYEIIKGDSVAVKGKVMLYKGELEIVIQELACLSCK